MPSTRFDECDHPFWVPYRVPQAGTHHYDEPFTFEVICPDCHQTQSRTVALDGEWTVRT